MKAVLWIVRAIWILIGITIITAVFSAVGWFVYSEFGWWGVASIPVLIAFGIATLHLIHED